MRRAFPRPRSGAKPWPRAAAALALVALLAPAVVACGDDTPGGDALVAPSDREAVPFDREAARMTAQARKKMAAPTPEEMEEPGGR